MNNTLIGVYGTLRKGYGNHRLLHGTKYIGIGFTKNKYKMTANGIPFVKKDEEISKIKVEVYSVNNEQLQRLDRLEGYDPNNHDNSWYKRYPVEIILENNKEVIAGLYFNEQEGNILIESGDYKDYR